MLNLISVTKKGISYSLFLSIILTLTGCAGMSPFNKSTIRDNRLDSKELNYIQYYIDSPFTLEYKSSEANSIVDDNKIKHELTLFEKDIIIVKNTPGIFDNLDESTGVIHIKFAEDIILGFKLGDEIKGSPLVQFNNIEIEENSRIEFRNQSWVVRFGARGVSEAGQSASSVFRSGNTPKLVYKYSSKMKKQYEAEIIKGMKVQ